MSGRRAASLATLRGRSLAELKERGVQAVSARLEHAGWRDARELSTDDVMSRLTPAARGRGERATADQWWARFRARGGKGFFGSLDDRDGSVGALGALDPAAREELVQRAERFLAGRFDLLGYPELSFGDPPDWHLDPLRDIRAPRIHWSRVRYLDPGVVGDHKVVWELNRHQWIVTLAQAWWVTGDARYADGAVRALADWMDANPPNCGVNWASSLEIAFRAISWLWVLRLLGTSDAMTSAVGVRAVGHLLLSARHVMRYLSSYFSPNTHLTGEALGLFYLGAELRDFAGADRWLSRGREILLSQLPRHVRADGTYFEQATWYHRYTLDFYLHLELLSERIGAPAPSTVRDAISRLATHLAAITRPDGSMPLIGDDDGGRLLKLDGLSAADARPALAGAALVTGRGDLASVASRPSSELVWLFGSDAAERFERLRPAMPAFTSRAFEDGGTYVMRDHWGADASVMVLDAGVHGALNSGHSHADALSFDLTVRGVPILVDPGTFAYTVDLDARNRFRSTIVHNTVSIGGASSSQMDGPFSWRRVARSDVHAWTTTPAADYLHASHDGYMSPPRRVTHERRVLFVKSGTWVIRDLVRGVVAEAVILRHQCAPGLTVRITTNEALIHADGTLCVRLLTFSPNGTTDIVDGAVSPMYGRVVHAAAVRHVERTGGSGAAVEVITVVLAANEPVTNVERILAGPASGVRIHRRNATDTILFNNGSGIEVEDVESDAATVWLRRDQDSRQVVGWLAAGAQSLRVGGTLLLGSNSSRDGWGGGVGERLTSVSG